MRKLLREFGKSRKFGGGESPADLGAP